MTIAVIITICTLLLLAYVFDITSSKTKIPSVIFLLLLGWGVKQITLLLEIPVPNLTLVLPLLGTIGLILIVLEGSLELELNRSKYKVIAKSFFVALLPMLLLSFGLAYAFQYFGGIPFKTGLTNAIPLAIISSAIAIPSAMNLLPANKEFITYESSLSDILGIIFFNFIVLNDVINKQSFGYFFLDLLITFIISIVATIGLTLLISKIKHHVKFVPIILLIVLVYSISKINHLPALILIIFFRLFLANLEKLKRFEFYNRMHPEKLEKEISRFKELTSEAAFLIRSLFFLLFGYLIETSELLNLNTIVWAVLITTGIFIIRALHLLIMRLPFRPLLFIAPRGLITILLFLSIPLEQTFKLVNRSLIIQVIILTSLVMMYGLMNNKKKKTEVVLDHEKDNEENPEDQEVAANI